VGCMPTHTASVFLACFGAGGPSSPSLSLQVSMDALNVYVCVRACVCVSVCVCVCV
jgi:hypothetical protein